MMRRTAWLPTVLLPVTVLAAVLVPASPAAAAPAIASFSPASGPVGTKVIIYGSGFSPGPVTVAFNGVAASNPKVNGAGTQISAAVPPFATTGPIRVSTPDGAFAESPEPFAVTFGAFLSPKALWAGQRMRISGSAYPPDTDVAFSIGGTVPLDGTATDANGNFSVVRTIPQIPPGKTLMLVILCPTVDCAAVSLPFSLFGDWPQERFDATESGYSDQEWKIGKANVAKLHWKYTEWFGSGVTTPLVEWGGRTYVGSSGEVLGAPAPSGTVDIYYPTAQDPTGLAVAGGVLYVVTRDRLYAFDAKGSKSCSVNKVCAPLWTASLGTGFPPYPYPDPPVVADGKVFLSEPGFAGNDRLEAFDASGQTNCSGSPKVCAPLWSVEFEMLFGPPAVSPFSQGGSRKLYVASATWGSGCCKVEEYKTDGSFVQSAKVPTASVVGDPDFVYGLALSAGRVAVTTYQVSLQWSTVAVFDASTLAPLWSSTALDNWLRPSAPAMTPAAVFVANGRGQLLAFAAGGCGYSTCGPLWTSAALGPGNSIAPIVANGVVYVAANADSYNLDRVYAFDAAGTQGCSGSPKVCSPLLTYQGVWSGHPGVAGDPGGLIIAGGTLYAAGGVRYDAIGT